MRTKNSVINIMYGLGGQLLNTVLNFLAKTIFIYVLGANYLGVSGLFSNILSMLSLAELGVGTAIVFHMYKPLAEKDEHKINALMNLYSKAYRNIGIVVGVLGIFLIPFLRYIIRDVPDIPNLITIYLLFLGNSVVSYFFAYKSAIITADQKNYIITIRRQVFNIIQLILQSIILFVFKNYIMYLIIQVICSFLVNLSIARKANNLYPYIKNKKDIELDNKTKEEIFKHVKAMMSHKIGSVVVNGTDNILISSFVGVYWVGLYSNYVMIINMINGFINQIFLAITSSIGNLNAKGDKEKSYKVYKKVNFMNFWIYGFSSICLFILLNPFVKLWVGEKFVLSKNITLIIVANFFISGMRQTNIAYKSTLGLFWNDRYKPLVESAINIIVSVILLKRFGLVGVLLGTFISTIATSFWIEPYVLFKHGFKQKVGQYFSEYLKYILITLVTGYITKVLCDMVHGELVIDFIIKLCICICTPNILFSIILFKNNEFNEFKLLIMNIIKRKYN